MMILNQIYKLAIELGIKNDLRGSAMVKKKLEKVKKAYYELTEAKKEEFDEERLVNPFSDTRIFGNPNKQIKKVMAGIDIDVAELLVARELGNIDLIIAHHPIGLALAGLHEVMDLQVELMAKYGVPINVAENLTQIRMSEVSRGISPVNHNKVLDAARNLGMDVMCVHTPSDNMVANFLDKEIKKNLKKIETVGDLLNLLKKIPEYQEAIRQKAGPRLFCGKPERYAGKIALTEITGGTEGNKEIYSHIAQAGIGTIVGMHMKEENREEAEKAHLNILIAGHMSSDSIGMNLFLDELVKRGIEVVPCSGLIRHARVKKAVARKKTAKSGKK